jgi:hypothetical protein
MARPTPTPSPVAGFLALPALPSLLFPVSAACLAAGAWGVLGPAMDDPERFVERLAAVGVVLAYAGALAGAAWLLCRWQAANPDAIGVILLLAMVLAGGGLALDTIAYTSPLGALAMGLWLVAVAAGAARVLHRTVLSGGPGWAPAALVALAAWHGLGPALVGWWAGLEQTLTDPADPLMGGWGLQLAAAWMVAWMPLGNPADRPFLHRPMAWRVVLVAALVAGGLHTASQGWMVMLDLGWGDHLAWIAPVLLALWRDVPWTGAAGTGLRVLTALLPLAVLLAGATHAAHLPAHAAEGGLRGWGLAHGGWLGLPAVTGGLVAVWAAVQGWRWRHWRRGSQ